LWASLVGRRVYPIYNSKPPTPMNVTLTASTTTFDHANGCRLRAALVLNPFAAFKPVAVGLDVAAASVPAAVAPPTLGLPDAVWVTANSFEACVALGIAAPLLAKETIFEY
jgi:hypothetical protein